MIEGIATPRRLFGWRDAARCDRVGFAYGHRAGEQHIDFPAARDEFPKWA